MTIIMRDDKHHLNASHRAWHGDREWRNEMANPESW